MASKPKLPAIPAVPNDVTPGLRGLLSAMREVLQVQAGQGRGDELDKAVTFRDLGLTSIGGSSTAMMGRVINGLIERGEIGTNNPVERPTTPTGVSVSAFIGGIAVSWDLPRYSGHAYTEVFAQPTIVNAQEQPVDPPALNTETMLLGTSASPLLGVQARTMLGYYIWVRHVNSLGQVGPTHTPLGTFLYLPPNPSWLLEQLTNEVTRDQLSVELQTPIDKVSVLETAISTEQKARADAVSALASDITTVQAYVNGDMTNLFLNPNFDPGQPHGFSGNGDANVHDAAYQWAPAGCPAPHYLEIWNRDVNGKTIPVTPGDVYHFGMSCATGDGGAPRIGIGCMALNASGGVMGYYLVATRSDANPTWKKISGEMTVPNGCTHLRMWVQLDYFRDANTNHWWAITGIQWVNANATKALAAAVQTNATAIANLDGTYTAQWSAKTTVGALNGGFGIFNDGTTTRFTVHANRFAIMDSSLGNTPFVPFVVDNGKTVIADAFIRTAYIEQLAAGQITADKINSLNLNAINITGGTLSLGGGNNMSFQEGGSAGFGKGGPYGGWGYGWNTIIYADGGIFTNRLYASGGTFTGTVNANGGTFNNVTIAENCDVRGTIYANKIVGDVIAIKPMNLGFYTGRAPYKIYKNQEVAAFSFNLSASNVARYIKINGSSCDGSNVYMKLYIGGNLVASRPNGVDGLYDVPAKSGVTVVQFNLWYVNNGADYIYTTARLVGEVVVYPVSSGTFV